MDSIHFVAFGILYLIMWAIVFFCSLGGNKDLLELYAPKDKRKRMNQKPRMKYLTRLSCEETLSRLLKMNTPFDSTFWKENDNEKDGTYVFEITEIPIAYRRVFCGSVKYRVMVMPAQEGSAVWLFLLALTRRWLLDADLLPIGRLGDDEMLNMFAWEVEKLLEKLLNAVRVE